MHSPSYDNSMPSIAYKFMLCPFYNTMPGTSGNSMPSPCSRGGEALYATGYAVVRGDLLGVVRGGGVAMSERSSETDLWRQHLGVAP